MSGEADRSAPLSGCQSLPQSAAPMRTSHSHRAVCPSVSEFTGSWDVLAAIYSAMLRFTHQCRSEVHALLTLCTCFAAEPAGIPPASLVTKASLP